MGMDDVVRCAFCSISLKRWEPEDVPFNEHRKHSPSCPFLLQQDVGNVPLPDVQLQSPTETFPLEWRNVSFRILKIFIIYNDCVVMWRISLYYKGIVNILPIEIKQY